MNIKELQQKSEAEITELLRKERNALRVFRFHIGQGKVKNNKEGRMLRKNIARMLTFFAQKNTS